MLPRSWGPGSLAAWRPRLPPTRDLRSCSPAPRTPPKPSMSSGQLLPPSGSYRPLSPEPLCLPAAPGEILWNL